MVKLNLDRDKIDESREYAETIVRPLQRYIQMHSTVSVERAVLRLLGFSGSCDDSNGNAFPLANLIVDRMDKKQLSSGAATLMAAVKKKYNKLSPQKMGEKIASGEINLSQFEELPPDKAQNILKPWIESAVRQIEKCKQKKDDYRYRFRPTGRPLKNICISTGNIDDDCKMGELAFKNGADIITLVRSTAQSLLEYIPCGETSDGYGGTFLTQENTKKIKKSLFDVSKRTDTYAALCIDSSGLCMPEMSVVGILEGVEYVVNDALYAILFRDINMKRTLIDQNFSRNLLAKSGVTMQTSEESFLLGKDASLKHHELLAAHFINEQLARNAGFRDDQIGLSYAFEVDAKSNDSITFEIAIAQLLREVFPRSPIRHIAATYQKSAYPDLANHLNTIFHLVGVMTQQNQQMLCLPSFPYAHTTVEDIYQNLNTMNYVFQAARSLSDELQFSSNGKIMRRARMILENAHKLLQKVSDSDFFEALETGIFGEMIRTKGYGRGLDGVFQKSKRYFNPFMETN